MIGGDDALARLEAEACELRAEVERLLDQLAAIRTLADEWTDHEMSGRTRNDCTHLLGLLAILNREQP